jgi:hypothetical protein
MIIALVFFIILNQTHCACSRYAGKAGLLLCCTRLRGMLIDAHTMVIGEKNLSLLFTFFSFSFCTPTGKLISTWSQVDPNELI